MDIQPSVVLAWIQAVGLVLAGVAGILWSKRFRAAKRAEKEAKDAQIQAKDAVISSKRAEAEVLKRQIEELRSLNPVTWREYFRATTMSLTEYTEDLEAELQASRSEADEQQEQVFRLEEELNRMREELLEGHAEQVVSLREEISEKEAVLQSQEEALDRLRERNRFLEEHVQQVRESGDESGLFRTIAEFDRLYKGFYEAAGEQDFESMEATHERFREDLQRLESLSVYAARLDAAMTNFIPRYGDFIETYRARLREAGDQGLSGGELAGYEGTKFSLIRKLMWEHYGARRELEPGNWTEDPA